jgi:mitogen-activated protein kinase 1/3/mitogen-activated protein kinase 6
MWSVGCIFAEMLQRKPLLPGTDTKNQIELICEYLGTPDVDNMKHIPEESKKLIKNLPKNKKNGKDFNKLFSFANTEAIDLLKKLLTFDPDKRINVTDALAHPYLKDLHLEDDEPTREPVDYLDFEFEDHNLTTQQLKGTLYLTKIFCTKKYCCTTISNFTRSMRRRKQKGKV